MLAPLPQPGLMLFPGFTAQRPELLFVRADTVSSTKADYQVSIASRAGGPGATLLRIKEEERRTIVFRMPNGQEAMRIIKQVHNWSGKGPEYHAYAPNGRKLWHLCLELGLLRTKYNMKLEPSEPYLPLVEVEKDTSSGSLSLLVNGCLATTITKPEVLKWRRENMVNVAPGMDILLALGLTWIRYDKHDMDAKALGQGLGHAGDAIADASIG